MTMRQIFAYPLPKIYDTAHCAASMKDEPYTLFFDSADRTHPLSRYSYIAFSPFETIEAKDDHMNDPFKILQDRLRGHKVWQTRPDLPPFQGGAAGFFGYDLARVIETLPAHAAPHTMPDMMIGLYDQLIAFDHQANCGWYITHSQDEAHAIARKEDVFARLERTAPPAPQTISLSFTTRLSRAEYERDLQKLIDYIHAGDIFQANLTRQFEATLPDGFDHFAHYCHLRKINAAPFAAYMNFGGLKIASASPERFISVQDGIVDTRPIKGTRPRIRHDEQADRAMMDELQHSEKDRAENAMIVDLLRNDLSKNCDDHSVDVPQLCGLESFAHVHHLVSIVTGKLSGGKDAVDLLRGCFPGGSITGAPKIRAMEIIDELEPVRRGIYCGALGYIGFNGTMDTNIVIRTLIYQGNRVHFNVGGGIVADSKPADEFEETLHKAEGIFRSFSAPDGNGAK